MASVSHLINPSSRLQAWSRAQISRIGRGVRWAWVDRQSLDGTERAVDDALARGVTRLVVWGGDGTLHRVVRRLFDKQALSTLEVILVPTGTCNDLARWVGARKEDWWRYESPVPPGKVFSMPLGWARWGHTRSGNVTEDLFLNNAGFGRPKSSPRRETPWRVLREFRPLRTRVHWGEAALSGEYYMMLVSLGPYFSKGLHFEPGQTPEKTRLRAYLVPATSKTRLGLRLLTSRLTGRPLADEKITKLTGLNFAADVEEPLWPQLDGDPVSGDETHYLDCSLLNERWRLRVIER